MWLSLPRLLGVLAPLPIVLACASGGARANVITTPELDRSKDRYAYDAIRHIRPEMLRSRDGGTLIYFKPRQPMVAVDDRLVGGVEVLRTLPTDTVARIEYVSSWVAENRYRSAFRNGLMLIETRPDSEPEFAAGPSSSR